MRTVTPQYVDQAADVCVGLPTKYARKVLRALGWDVAKKLATRNRWTIAIETKKKKVTSIIVTSSPEDCPKRRTAAQMEGEE